MSETINIVAQSYGRETEHRRAIFTLLSFYAHVSSRFRRTKALLYTDNASYFEPYFKGLPVQYLSLTEEKLQQLRGKNDFVHRVKIALIEDAFRRLDGNLLYIDSDTFFIEDPSSLFSELREDVTFMHLREYRFADLQQLPLPSGAPFHAVLRYIESNDFILADGKKQKFSPSLYSWNAGVILLHRINRFILPDVYAITDQLFEATGNHASEQYAFSLVLQGHTKIVACDSFIYHYWNGVKKRIADGFLKRNIGSSRITLSSQEGTETVLKWTRHLPLYFENHALMFKDKSIQAFNTNEFAKGYLWAFRALIKNPFSITFIRDVAYHTRRFLSGF